MRSTLLAVALLASLPVLAAEDVASDGKTWHRLVGILQYLEADYPAAVESQSAFELTEQKSFAGEALRATQELGPTGAKFLPRVKDVAARVEKGADPEGVSALCGQLVAELVAEGGLARSPRR